jgi:3-dehydroquinate synthase
MFAADCYRWAWAFVKVKAYSFLCILRRGMEQFESIDAGGYPVINGENVFGHLSGFLETGSYSSIFILVDDNTLRHCLPGLIANVEKLQDAEILEIDSGEENKSIEVCTQLWSALGELGADRRSLLVNLGGGVVGDMGGFVAATFKRGIDFINIPTTLLSQVDASVGGKTGVDLGSLKNEVGVFCDPKAVYIHTDFLYTLEQRQLRSGFAEVIKHALIAGKSYWKKVKSVDPAAVDELALLIPDSIEIKNKIVQEDPKEKGKRKALNFGHTIGHALESYALQNSISLLHGEAIAAGMICEAYISSAVAGLSSGQLSEITEFINEIFPPVKLPRTREKELLKLMRHDKKNVAGNINSTLLKEIGKFVTDKECDEALILESFGYYREKVRQDK